MTEYAKKTGRKQTCFKGESTIKGVGDEPASDKRHVGSRAFS